MAHAVPPHIAPSLRRELQRKLRSEGLGGVPEWHTDNYLEALRKTMPNNDAISQSDFMDNYVDVRRQNLFGLRHIGAPNNIRDFELYRKEIVIPSIHGELVQQHYNNTGFEPSYKSTQAVMRKFYENPEFSEHGWLPNINSPVVETFNPEPINEMDAEMIQGLSSFQSGRIRDLRIPHAEAKRYFERPDIVAEQAQDLKGHYDAIMG